MALTHGQRARTCAICRLCAYLFTAARARAHCMHLLTGEGIRCSKQAFGAARHLLDKRSPWERGVRAHCTPLSLALCTHASAHLATSIC
eukprot:3818547-Pleurochrysis_carterae.AAC.6